jgi:hypothetical protein
MTNNNSETPNQYSFWSTCLALVTVFAIADVITGGLLRESILRNSAEYATFTAFMIVTVGVYASDGPSGLKLVRACSFNKL